MNTGSDDLFESKLLHLKGIAASLWGGYYEPKSDRDIWLAKRIDELVVQSEFLIQNST